MGRNAAFELGAGHVRRIRFIVQVYLSMTFHGAAEDAGRDFVYIEQALFIMDLSYDIRKDQGRNIQTVHLQSAVDDRGI